MLVTVLRRDRPGMAALRARLQPAHADYQAPFLPSIVYGGAIVERGTDTAGVVPITRVVGNVLIMDVADRETAQAFHDNDPYTRHDLFETVIIEAFWQRVPPPEGS